MNPVAIKVENLSKRYRIGLEEEQHDTFVSAALAALNRPFRNLRRLRRLTRFSDDNPSPPSSVSGPLSHPQSSISDLPSDIIWALKDVSFEVQQGEIVGIIGHNGAGKSTLLKILSRITHPTTGRVEIRGRVSSLLEVGTGFHPELTGRENIYLNGTILGMRKAEIDRKFNEIIDFSGVEKFIDTPVKRYSSGMRVRLAFSVAAHLEPEILLIDEVLAVGDAAFQKKALGKMGDVVNEGRTVLFVSHNMTAIKSLCQKSILLENGQILFEGLPDEVVTFYLKQTTEQISEKSWAEPKHAPGNELVRLKRVCVVPGMDRNLIDVKTPFNIEFEFWNFQDDAELNYSLVLYTTDDVCVLNTGSQRQVYPAGVIKGICHVPGDFLNATTYRIRILLVQDSRAIFEDTNVISFEVTEGSRTGNWYGKWVGIVRPKFNWTNESFPFLPHSNGESIQKGIRDRY